MRKITGIARYTFVEIFRNRVYTVLLLFAAVLIGATLLLGALGGEQKNRMILDLGLVGIEAFALAVAVFAAVTLVSEEMESRTIYLILTRPVARHEFIIGRFLGLIALTAPTIGVMATGHFLLLIWQHAPVNAHYVWSLFYIFEKITLITSLAVLFSLFSTSTVSALTFTFFFWIMGHFTSEIQFMAQKSNRPLITLFCDFFYYITPNFQALNLRDMPATQTGTGWLISALAYGALYTASCLGLSVLLFRKKEF